MPTSLRKTERPLRQKVPRATSMADKAVLSSRPWWIYVRFSLRSASSSWCCWPVSGWGGSSEVSAPSARRWPPSNEPQGLEELRLGGDRIGNADLVQFRGMTNLRFLGRPAIPAAFGTNEGLAFASVLMRSLAQELPESARKCHGRRAPLVTASLTSISRCDHKSHSRRRVRLIDDDDTRFSTLHRPVV